MPYTYSNTSAAAALSGRRPVLASVAEQTARELAAAATSLNTFLDHPGKNTAAQALLEVSTYAGPLSERPWPDLLRLLTGRQRTALIIAALELYIRGENPPPAP